MNTIASNNQTKIAEWVRLFLDHIAEAGLETHVEHHEGYKFKSVNTFQTHFDIDASDLAGNLDVSIYNNNLVAGAMYFPKKMLLIYANQYLDETRNILKNLFDESRPIINRINETKASFEELEKLRAHDEGRNPHNTYIGLRFISLLLGYRYPETYNALKPSEWKVFARYIDPDFSIPHKTSPGEQYEIYTSFIEVLRQYIMTRPEIDSIRQALTAGIEFKDDAFRWTAQDVIFVTARAYAHKKSQEAEDHTHIVPTDQNDEANTYETNVDYSGEDTGFMALEAHLEEYVVRNWENIDFGENLELYVEEDGTTGQQYTTDVGIIDILAKDATGNFVVIELKRAKSGYKVVGQILNYIGWVQDKLALDGQQVRGLIVVGKADKTLLSSLKPISDKVKLKEYRVTMQLKDP